MSKILIIALVVVALLAFSQYVSTKNTLVAKNEAVKSAWSQVDVVLPQRRDLCVLVGEGDRVTAGVSVIATVGAAVVEVDPVVGEQVGTVSV